MQKINDIARKGTPVLRDTYPHYSIDSFQGRLRRVGVRLSVSINVIVVSLDYEDPRPLISTIQLRCCAQPESPQGTGEFDARRRGRRVGEGANAKSG